MSQPDPPDDDTRVRPKKPGSGAGTGAWVPAGLAPVAHEPAVRIGRFELREVLGEGAFGRVFLAFDPELERPVAIKVPHGDGLTLAFRDRFLREARATATVHHPNVCPVYDVGTEGDLPYIVMHYVVGGTLGGLLDKLEEPLPPRHAVAIARKLALGTAAAHAQGIVHRDLKPQNVLYDKASREVLITDFGLARISSSARQTAEGAVFGTPAYMSPEQARGRQDEVGPLSDVYSLGVILYRMLTGDVPFTGSVYEIMMQHVEAPPPRPSVRRTGLDPHIDAIVTKAMAKVPTERYHSAKDFGKALADYLRGSEQADSVAAMKALDRPTEPKPLVPTKPGAEKVSPHKPPRRPLPEPKPPQPVVPAWSVYYAPPDTSVPAPPKRPLPLPPPAVAESPRVRSKRHRRKWGTVCVLVLATVAAAAYCAWRYWPARADTAQQNDNAGAPARADTERKRYGPPPGWSQYAPPGGGYKAYFASAPKEVLKLTVQTEPTGKVYVLIGDQHVHNLDRSKGPIFPLLWMNDAPTPGGSVITVRFEPTHPHQLRTAVLRSVADTFLHPENVQPNVIERAEVPWLGQRADQVVVTNNKGLFVVYRTVSVGDAGYVAIVGDQGKRPAPEIEYGFFDTFEVVRLSPEPKSKDTEPKKPPEPKKADPLVPSIANGFAGHKFDQTAERRAAEWVLSLGGSVRVATPDGKGKWVNSIGGKPADLPTEFTVSNIDLTGSIKLKPIEDAYKRNFAGLSGPISIYLNNNSQVGDETVKVLACIPKLIHLDLGRTPALTDEGLAALANHPTLLHLHLHDFGVTAKGIQHLRTLRLTYLQLEGKATDDWLRPIADIPTLERLILWDTRIAGPGISELKRLKKLAILHLTGSTVTDDCLQHVAELSALEELSLRKTRIQGPGLIHLRKLPQLREINLSESLVQDTHMSYLTACSQLEVVALYGTGIGDTGARLLGKSTSLKTVYLDKTKVTPAGLRDLQQALPKCKIVPAPPTP
jgi:serine/threonine protein kinase